MNRILRVLAGVIIGLGYGLLIGVLTSLWWRLTNDPATPGPMIPNNHEWGRLVAFIATLFTGGCGVIVGLVVSLSGVTKVRGAMIGLVLGLVVLILMSVNSSGDLPGWSWRAWQTFLSVAAFFLLIFPIGLGLTGMVVATVAGKLKTLDTSPAAAATLD